MAQRERRCLEINVKWEPQNPNHRAAYENLEFRKKSTTTARSFSSSSSTATTSTDEKKNGFYIQKHLFKFPLFDNHVIFFLRHRRRRRRRWRWLNKIVDLTCAYLWSHYCCVAEWMVCRRVVVRVGCWCSVRFDAFPIHLQFIFSFWSQ